MTEPRSHSTQTTAHAVSMRLPLLVALAGLVLALVQVVLQVAIVRWFTHKSNQLNRDGRADPDAMNALTGQLETVWSISETAMALAVALIIAGLVAALAVHLLRKPTGAAEVEGTDPDPDADLTPDEPELVDTPGTGQYRRPEQS